VIVIFLGPPGSGKGTQAAVISDTLSLPSISTGDILRQSAKGSSGNSQELRECLASGKLVSSDLVNKLVYEFLKQDQYASGCILDGYPRNLNQAEFLDQNFPGSDIEVIYFNISYNVLLERISGRYSCAVCGAIYNKFLSPTEIDDVCDKCGSKELKTRDDDNIEVFSARWNEYSEQTKPLLDYYDKKGCLFEVDASQKKEDITNKVVNKLKRH